MERTLLIDNCMPAIACSPKALPPDLLLQAAKSAIAENPANRPRVEKLAEVFPDFPFAGKPEHLALLRTKYWGAAGVHLTVSFLDNPEPELRRRILSHLNAWREHANVSFVETAKAGQVRIGRDDSEKDGGYWSYVGTDTLEIKEASKATMNLEGFTMNTEEGEFRRVVRHEAGHTLGFSHEHMRKALLQRIDREKAYKHYWEKHRWSPAEVIAQVLTPLEESSLMGSTVADPTSIMCYQIPNWILVEGAAPILGGSDITAEDYRQAARLYPHPTRSSSRSSDESPVSSCRRGSGPDHQQHDKTFTPDIDPEYLAALLRALGRPE